MSKPTNHYWTLSFLSSVAGQFSSQGMGDLGRHFAWAANDVSDYWLQYIVDETKRFAITQNSRIGTY